MRARGNKPCMLIKQQNYMYMWCTFTKQTTGPVPHHSPAASGTANPPPPLEPTPASTSTSGNIAPPALPSTSENFIDLDNSHPWSDGRTEH